MMYKTVKLIFAFVLTLQTYCLSANIEIPVDTDTHIYGLGVDADYNKAQQIALGAINQKLSSQISSNVNLYQSKTNAKSTDSMNSQIISRSNNITINNANVITNTQKDNQFWLVLEVNKNDLANNLRSKIEQQHNELRRFIVKYKGKEGPSCWYESKQTTDQIRDLKTNSDVLFGLVADTDFAIKKRDFIARLEELKNTCVQNNKYKLVMPQGSSTELRAAVIDVLNEQGFLISRKSGLGTISLEQRKKYSFFYDNHIYITYNKLVIRDENGVMRKQSQFKIKGTSFDSKAEAQSKAELNLTKQIKSKLL